MSKLSPDEIRSTYIDFFAKKCGHTFVSSLFFLFFFFFFFFFLFAA